MSLIEDVFRDREDLARVLKKHKGIRRTVEDLYPDKAHFIYELLQNAEDTGATEASFRLSKTGLRFEHNGTPFSPKNVWGITDIGEGSKTENTDTIGRFGVGFKAVFAYCETPHIYSPTYSFKISDLVLPTELPSASDLGSKTRFEFPFNNPKKNVQEAHSEVRAGLEQLAETTLLFLSNLKSIHWQMDGQLAGEVSREEHSENHVEVVRSIGEKVISSSHFLRFSNPVEGVEKQRVSVAFALDYLPEVSTFHAGTQLAKQLKIIRANPGRVAVFFPAEKETSGLKFHLHAPFIPELSRASIKETPANLPLFHQLEKLVTQSLHKIRDLALLTPEFLGILPNLLDSLPLRYQSIRSAIIKEMNGQPLTPTHEKSFAPARNLLQARGMLKEVLSVEDINFLVPGEVPPQWAIGAPQKNGDIDRFLSGLAIKNWDVDAFVQVLSLKASPLARSFVASANHYAICPDPQFMAWLSAKPVEWHQQMYAVLHSDLQGRPEQSRFSIIKELRQLRIVRLRNGTYSTGACYFPTEGFKDNDSLPRVDPAVYSSSKSKTQQQEARSFLVSMGVRESSEVDEIRATLQQRYTPESIAPDPRDLPRFIAFLEKEPAQVKLFADYHFLQRENGKWGKPNQIYLDVPFLETGLTAFYKSCGANSDRAALATSYREGDVSVEKLVKFAAAVGAQTRLGITVASCWHNPAVDFLVYESSGGWSDNYGVNQDFIVDGLPPLLPTQNESLSRLVWKTLCEFPDLCWLKARYRNNSQHQFHEADSQLVCLLRDTPWIPQTNGTFVTPAKASRSLLPQGFPFDHGYKWLSAIGFEKDSQHCVEETQRQELNAKALGFPDVSSFDRAKQFSTLPLAEQEHILAEFQKRLRSPLPQNEPKNPERRAEKLAHQAHEAPERIVEKKMRSVSVGREDVKQETEQYLVQQYTNELSELFCQICQAPMPFKLDDGGYFIEKVEFLAELKRRHLRNYLCLCPNHSAMFQHANGSKNVLKILFLEMTGERLEIVLARRNATVYFTKTHIADLKAAIDGDANERIPLINDGGQQATS